MSTALYIDLELSCWETTPPPGVRQEIIEIGIVEMDLDSLLIIKDVQFYVRPKRLGISHRCTNITGITRDDLIDAEPLPEVLDRIAALFEPKGKRTCAWGDDLKLLDLACAPTKTGNPLRRPLDLSRLYRDMFLLNDTPSLQAALEMMGMKFDGVPHGALPDARNTALVHAAILRLSRGLPKVAESYSDKGGNPPKLTLSHFGQQLAALKLEELVKETHDQ